MHSLRKIKDWKFDNKNPKALQSLWITRSSINEITSTIKTSASEFHMPLKVQNGANPSTAVYGDKTYSHKLEANRFKWEYFLTVPGEYTPFQHNFLCSTILNIEREWQMWGRPESRELEAPELAMSACIATLNLAASAQRLSAIWWVTIRHVSDWVRHTHLGDNTHYDHVVRVSTWSRVSIWVHIGYTRHFLTDIVSFNMDIDTQLIFARMPLHDSMVSPIYIWRIYECILYYDLSGYQTLSFLFQSRYTHWYI